MFKFIVGSIIGSFTNCCAIRYVSNESIVSGRSHCPKCGHTLSWYELIPIISYLLLRGKCHHCGEKIPIRYLLVEIVMGFIYLLFNGDLMILVLITILAYEALIDHDSYYINVLPLFIYLIIFMVTRVDIFIGNAPIAFLYSLLIYLISIFLAKAHGQEVMGFGDIEMYFLVLLTIGFEKGLMCILLSCVLGILMIVIGHREKIAFGPAIWLAYVLLVL